MRLIAISVCVLAGAVMAAGGTLAESLPDVKRLNNVDEVGLIVTSVAALLFVAELLKWMPGGALPSNRRASDQNAT